MNTYADFKELQQVSDYRAMRNTLRSGGIGSIIFGLIGMGMGTAALQENPMNGFLVLIGAGLIVEGILVISVPWPGGVILDGAALLAVGAWNIFTTVNNMQSGGGTPAFGALGGLQIFWAFKRFGLYSRFAHLAGKPAPAAQAIVQIDDLVKGVLSAKGDDARSVVQFQSGDKAWKGRLFDTVAVMVEGGGEAVLFLDRSQITLAAEPADRKGKQFTIRFQSPDRTLAATIGPEGLDLCRRWKPCPVQPVASNQDAREEAIARSTPAIGVPIAAGAQGGTRYWSFHDGRDY